jgi:hypothetical protein
LAESFSHFTVGDILVTIDGAQFNAEPRCDILAAIAEHREIRQVFVPLVERVALLPSQGLEDTNR